MHDGWIISHHQKNLGSHPAIFFSQKPGRMGFRRMGRCHRSSLRTLDQLARIHVPAAKDSGECLSLESKVL